MAAVDRMPVSWTGRWTAPRAGAPDAPGPADGHRAVLGMALLVARTFVSAVALLRYGSPLDGRAGTAGGLLLLGTVVVGVAMVGPLLMATAGRRVRAVFVADVLLAYAITAVALAAGLPELRTLCYHLLVTVALWAVVLGMPAALVVIAGWMVLWGGGRFFGVLPGNPAALTQAVLLVATATAAAVTAAATRIAVEARWQAAVRVGRDLESRETRRWLHDSVVQTLEAIALLSDGPPSREVLGTIHRAAHAEAASLRDALDRTDGRPPDESLERAVRHARRNGVRVTLTLAVLPADLLPARAAALYGATGEALRNLVKHARTDEARVRFTVTAERVIARVSDGGVGFDPRDRRAGFGLAECIEGRLADVGGGCEITSAAGRGTAVVMWVPR